MTLLLVRPLPGRWDGRVVHWSEFAAVHGSVNVHFPPRCEECGATSPPWHAIGRVLADPDRKGVRHWVIRFRAERCRTCQHDVVFDEQGGVWDLGPEDYGPQGSTEIVGSLW